MKNYIGKKIRGFKFKNKTDDVYWNEIISNFIGKIGKIIFQGETYVTVQFKNGTAFYPISLIEQNLVKDYIPQLGKGVLMEVSNDLEKWNKELVIAKLSNGVFIDEYTDIWKYVRTPNKPKYTHAELIEKLGHDFEYIK